MTRAVNVKFSNQMGGDRGAGCIWKFDMQLVHPWSKASTIGVVVT